LGVKAKTRDQGKKLGDLQVNDKKAFRSKRE